MGLSLKGGDFGLIMQKEQGGAGRSWTALKALASEISVVGIDGLTVKADSVEVEINRASTVDQSLVNYKAVNKAIKTGPGVEMILDMDSEEGQLLRASGNLEIDVYGFLQVSGGFALEKKTGQVRVTGESSNKSVDLLTLGGVE